MGTDDQESDGSRADVASESRRPTLSVVMPVYNEAMYLKENVEAWIRILRGLDVPFEFLAYDDGSTDGSGEILDECSESCSRLRVVHQPNRGHGPTIRSGYEAANGQWIMQSDSDNEIPPGEFDQLWPLREKFDFVIGRRAGRKLGFARKCVVWCARMSVRIFFGSGIRDVNSPFRLMRGDFVRASLPLIPRDAFAPNLFLSGLAVRGRRQVREVPVISQSHRIMGASRPLSVGFGQLVSMFFELWKVSRKTGK